MRSKASYDGHPIHPALIPFPLAFLIGAFAFDFLGRLLGKPAFWTTGAYLELAGVCMGVLAAIPGIIDYFYTVPPNSSGRRRAGRHALAMLSAVALFACVWWLRGDAGVQPDGVLVVIEAVGAGLLLAGGWMGGVLVNRNQIGVDPRYARAGKWKEARVRGTRDQPLVVARSDELELDQMKLLRVGGRRVVLARTEQGYVAFDDHCTHRGGSLAGGSMICGTVQCPWHGSQFDVSDGAVKAGPAQSPIRTYTVQEVEGEVRLILS